MTQVSVNVDDLAAVVELACCVESRDNGEQKALLAVAERVDKNRNRQTSDNIDRAGAMWRRTGRRVQWGKSETQTDEELERVLPESWLERQVDATRLIEEKGERRVRPSWERKKR